MSRQLTADDTYTGRGVPAPCRVNQLRRGSRLGVRGGHMRANAFAVRGSNGGGRDQRRVPGCGELLCTHTTPGREGGGNRHARSGAGGRSGGRRCVWLESTPGDGPGRCRRPYRVAHRPRCATHAVGLTMGQGESPKSPPKESPHPSVLVGGVRQRRNCALGWYSAQCWCPRDLDSSV